MLKTALREKVMMEARSSPFTVHVGLTKIYRDLKQYFWWNGMKQDVATFISKCMTCQQVKIEHQRASGLLQPLEIPMWKWDEISMDFIAGLPTTHKTHDAIWVEIVRLHGTRTSIVSDRDSRFTSHFWKGLQKAWGTRLKFSTVFHPQTNGQSERTIQNLEDMLKACALEWTGERLIEGLEFIEITNEKVVVAKEKLKEVRSRQKSYADKHRRDLEFQVGDRVFLKVSPFEGVKCFGIKGKLSPRFIGPFEILERIGEVKTINDEVRIEALIDEKRVNIKEYSIRCTLKLDDAEGTSCLANAKIFDCLTKMGYEKLSEKLTFYKAFFSPQWKFLIHTILWCLRVDMMMGFDE
nr:retrotransposon protein, putative, Ty3-gypsy subclass [Tanacetum cinerariifolium]